MCFSNLPVEFDDEGNPYLAEEADEVDGLPDAECECRGDVPLAEDDPEAVVEDILETLPADVRERVADGATGSGDAAGAPAADGDGRTAGGD